jgi:hypothetical protein
MLNFAVDPAVLLPRVPAGTELDSFEGGHFASMVGFLFDEVRLLGVPVPFHRRFEEVNLRFYVRRKERGVWKRGVAFMKEIVPKHAVTTVARILYGEPYVTHPMRHSIRRTTAGIDLRYEWRRGGRWESIAATAAGEPHPMEPGSLQEFIAEHYWGYTARRGGTAEYEVGHPPWRIREAETHALDADIAALYGEEFARALAEPPASVFIAEGSAITVRRGGRIR